jgi:D-serine deaminase-like pyridoxal phosphate-dependent protein
MNYSTILRNEHAELPCAFVDLEAFDSNLESLANMVKGTNFTIRVATKSIRVPDLIRRALNYGEPFKGLMCFSAHEALFLSTQGFDDFLVAYPTLQESDLRALRKVHESGKLISLVVDCEEHLVALNSFMQGTVKPFPVLLEPDLSLRFGSLVIGVRRSPLRTVDALITLAKKIKNYPNLRFMGLMAYEAHIAGVTDRNPFKKILSSLLYFIRRFAMKKVIAHREELVKKLKEAGLSPELVNGGGTGSLSFNHEEKVLTEVTAGSGMFCSHLFDYYSNFHLKPSAFFALQAVRKPEAGWVTCQGGGYIASGEPGWDRIPRPVEGKLSGFEATGEVQTPVELNVELGSPVIFRHSKAGELSERFKEFRLISGGKTVGKALTYRGYGENYF